MKRITFSGASIVTGNATTQALLDYTTSVANVENSCAVDITVLEDNGETATHTLLLSPVSQLDIVDVGGIPDDDEDERFPVPVMPQIGMVATAERGNEAARNAEDFDRMMTEIDDGLGQ